MADKTFTLNTGAKIPALGLGTWQGDKGVVKDAVLTAIKSGYRLIDGAYVYGNEEEVGAGIREAISSGVVKREDLFVVSKCWCTYNTRCDEALDMSLKLLGLDYIDLYLVHWPILMNPKGNDEKFPKLANGDRDIIRTHNHVDTWKLMEKLPATGKTKAIGVSNYSKAYLEQLLPQATVVPAVNQVENHPQLPQQELVDFCKAKGIHIMAYSPLGSTGGPLLTAEPVVKIAEKHSISPAAVLLGYQIARGITVIPKSVNPDRIRANAQLKDLDADDLKLLNDYSEQLARDGKLNRYVFPPFGSDFGFPDKVGKI